MCYFQTPVRRRTGTQKEIAAAVIESANRRGNTLVEKKVIKLVFGELGKMKRTVLLVVVSCCVAPAVAGLYTFTDSLGQSAELEVEYWTGAGAAETLLVVDWNQTGTYHSASHAFGYRWDGSPRTVASMLDDIVSNGDLGAIIENASFGDYIGDLTYNGADADVHTHDEYGSWGLANTGDLTAQWGAASADWTMFGDWTAGSGIHADTIADGFVQGINAVYYYNTEKVSQYLDMPFSVPEPATLALLAAGGLLLRRKK